MKKIVLVALVMVGCWYPKPTPTPTPPPPPVGPEFPNLVLHRSGTTLVYADGSPFPFRETIACCVGATGTEWPDINKATIDQYLTQGRATVFHFRVGPFSGMNESEFSTLGGGYTPDGARVNLDSWNEPYWQHEQDTCRYANEHGAVCEVVVVDDWVLKVQVYGGKNNSAKWRIPAPAPAEDPTQDAPPLLPERMPKYRATLGEGVPYPWHPAGNIQGEDARSQAPTPRQEAWIRKVVQTFWKLGVVWQLGNEEAQVQGYTFESVTKARARIVQDEEDRLGSPHHLLSTNSDADEALTDPIVTWFIVHNGLNREVLPERIASNNEYNPSVPASCSEARAQWCKARQYSGYYAAWRHEMTEGDWVCLQGTISEGGACAAWEQEGCEAAQAAVDTIACKRFSGSMYDCTPKRGGNPIKAEGTINRPDCEYMAMGKGFPEFSLAEVTGNLSLHVRGNPLQFVAQGSGRGRLVCTVPSRGATNVCRSSTGGPLWIEQ